MKWFDLRSLSRGEALTCVVLALLFLTATGLFIGLRPEHLLITGLFVVLFFAAPATRRLAVALAAWPWPCCLSCSSASPTTGCDSYPTTR